MSKNIVINNNGTTETWEAVDAIRVNAVGGGTVDYMPEDEIEFGIITINKNGMYEASDYGLYGYREVTVEVSGTVTGYIDGELYTVTVDEYGDLVETHLEA